MEEEMDPVASLIVGDDGKMHFADEAKLVEELAGRIVAGIDEFVGATASRLHEDFLRECGGGDGLTPEQRRAMIEAARSGKARWN